MSRLSAALGSALFLLAAPAVVVGVIPWLITRWRVHTVWFAGPITTGLGFVLVAIGVSLLLEAFARFTIDGLGTPAPFLPTRHLVVVGSYRHVRNPMYVAVLCIIYGQALVLADGRLAVYGIVVWLCSHLFIRAYEEPTLHRVYGDEYRAYCADVPRWLPRLKAWTKA